MEKKFKVLLLVAVCAFYQNGVFAYRQTQLQHDADYAALTPLSAAVIAHDIDKVRSLLDGGVRIDEKVNRYSALMHAVRQAVLEITVLLLSYNAPITPDELERVIVESHDTDMRDACVQAVLGKYPELKQKTGMGVKNMPHVQEQVLLTHTGK